MFEEISLTAWRAISVPLVFRSSEGNSGSRHLKAAGAFRDTELSVVDIRNDSVFSVYTQAVSLFIMNNITTRVKDINSFSKHVFFYFSCLNKSTLR